MPTNSTKQTAAPCVLSKCRHPATSQQQLAYQQNRHREQHDHLFNKHNDNKNHTTATSHILRTIAQLHRPVLARLQLLALLTIRASASASTNKAPSNTTTTATTTTTTGNSDPRNYDSPVTRDVSYSAGRPNSPRPTTRTSQNISPTL